MVSNSFKLFFKVVETYEERGYLVLVSNRTDSGLARSRETIGLKCPGKPSTFCEASVVKFWRRDNSCEIPFCMAVKGFKAEDVPVGSEVWIQQSRPIQDGRKRFEYIETSECSSVQDPAASGVAATSSAAPQSGFLGGEILVEESAILQAKNRKRNGKFESV